MFLNGREFQTLTSSRHYQAMIGTLLRMYPEDIETALSPRLDRLGLLGMTTRPRLRFDTLLGRILTWAWYQAGFTETRKCPAYDPS
jgi:hypothetical protein